MFQETSDKHECKQKHTHVHMCRPTWQHQLLGLGWQVMFSHLCGEIAISARSQITQLFITDAGALTLPLWGWRRARLVLSLGVCSTRACVCVREEEETSNRRWTADMPHHAIWEERGKRRKGKWAVINMAIKEIWSGRWGSKSRRRRGKELVPLSSL